MDNGSFNAVFHQASGMVSVQAGCRIPAAVILMEHRAAAQGRTVNQVAQDVVDHLTDFNPTI